MDRAEIVHENFLSRVASGDLPQGAAPNGALSDAEAGASPLTVWEGSHEIMRARLLEALEGVPESGWRGVDLTTAYQAARREVGRW